MVKPGAKPLISGAVVLGSELVGFTVLGVTIDYLLGTLNHIPWATLILTPIGLIVAMMHLLRLVRPVDSV